MSNTNTKTETVQPVSAKLANLIRPILREFTGTDEEGNPECVSRDVVAAELVKRHRKAMPKWLKTNQQALYHLIGAGVECGQFPGYKSRLGRNGGIFRDPKYRPVKVAPAAETE